MNARAASWLAWSLAGLSFVMFVSSVALFFLTRSAPVSGRDIGDVHDLLIFVPLLAFPVVGALIVSKRPENPIGWICLADGLVWMLVSLIDGYAAYGLAAPGPVPFVVTIWALTAWLWVPAVGLLGIYLLLLFPDGRLPSRRWRPLAWLSGAVMILCSVGIVLVPGPLQGLEGTRNPFGLEGYPWLLPAANIVLLLFPLCMLASALSLVLRYRRSGGVVREQIKWIAFAGSFVIFVVISVFAFVPMNPSGADLTLWLSLLEDVMALSFAGIPLSIGFAVLRYRLYDIDVIINRALVYGSLTATLVGIYFGGVVSLQYAFRALTGSESQLAVVASTLVIAALFNPLRRHIQALIDRRFYRNKYDAAKTLEGFGVRLRDEVDLDDLKGDLTGVVRETVQPAHVSLWLRPPGLRFGETSE